MDQAHRQFVNPARWAWMAVSHSHSTGRALCRMIAMAAAFGLGVDVHLASAQIGLTCGQLVNGSIDAPLEQDVFTPAADAGDTVTITFVQTAAVDPAFVAFGHLFSPTGAGPRAIGGASSTCRSPRPARTRCGSSTCTTPGEAPTRSASTGCSRSRSNAATGSRWAAASSAPARLTRRWSRMSSRSPLTRVTP